MRVVNTIASVTFAPQDEYQARLRAAIHRAVEEGARCFQEICERCEGAYPATIWDLFNEDFRALRIPVSSESRTPRVGVPIDDDLWTEPSPMDHEWRFTRDTAARLAEAVGKCETPILCLGTPSVFAALGDLGLPAVLIERNPITAALLARRLTGTIYNTDVAELPQELFTSRYERVIMDPPWYPPHIRYWLQQALSLTESGARIFLTLFPPLTRPSALSERAELTSYLESLGELDTLGRLSYATPTFEQESLRAAGLPPLPGWRAGQLLRLTLQSEAIGERVERPDEPVWHHFAFGSQVVGLRSDITSSGEISIQPLYPDGSYLLKTVSARDPIRASIGIWTSRNRCARASGGDRLYTFLTQLQSGEAPARTVKAIAHSEADKQSLQRLVALIGL
jgi:hypothetical protein